MHPRRGNMGPGSCAHHESSTAPEDYGSFFQQLSLSILELLEGDCESPIEAEGSCQRQHLRRSAQPARRVLGSDPNGLEDSARLHGHRPGAQGREGAWNCKIPISTPCSCTPGALANCCPTSSGCDGSGRSSAFEGRPPLPSSVTPGATAKARVAPETPVWAVAQQLTFDAVNTRTVEKTAASPRVIQGQEPCEDGDGEEEATDETATEICSPRRAGRSWAFQKPSREGCHGTIRRGPEGRGIDKSVGAEKARSSPAAQFCYYVGNKDMTQEEDGRAESMQQRRERADSLVKELFDFGGDEIGAASAPDPQPFPRTLQRCFRNLQNTGPPDQLRNSRTDGPSGSPGQVDAISKQGVVNLTQDRGEERRIEGSEVKSSEETEGDPWAARSCQGVEGFRTAFSSRIHLPGSATKRGGQTLLGEEESIRSKGADPSVEPEGGPVGAFLGFSTASGKVINVSDSAMHRGKQLIAGMQDGACGKTGTDQWICGPTAAESQPRSVGDALGSSKASGSAANAADRAMNMSSGDDNAGANAADDWAADEACGSVKLGGFRTASGKGIPVSETAIQRGRHLMSDLQDEARSSMPAGECECGESNQQIGFQMFSPASEKEVRMPDSAMRKAERMMAAAHDEPRGTKPSAHRAEQPIQGGYFQSFAAASGKGLSLSEILWHRETHCMSGTKRKLAKTTGECVDPEGKQGCAFQELLTAPSDGIDAADSAEQRGGQPTSGTRERWQEAKGAGHRRSLEAFGGAPKGVAMVAKGIRTSGRSVQERPTLADTMDEASDATAAGEHAPEGNQGRAFQGFSTATKGVITTESPVQMKWKTTTHAEGETHRVKGTREARKIGGSQHLGSASRKNICKTETEMPIMGGNTSNVADMLAKAATKQGGVFQGFSTASGKEIHVSESALQRGKRFVADTEDQNHVADVTDHWVPPGHDEGFKLQGGASASGKGAQISEPEMRDGRHLMAEIEDADRRPEADAAADQQGIETGRCVDGFRGFSTASGKGILLSEAAMQRGRHLMAEIEDADRRPEADDAADQQGIETGRCVDGFRGFSTASGKGILLSEAAMQRGRHLMEEIEETNNTKATDGNQEVPVIGGDLQGFSTPASRGIGVSRAQSFRKEKLVLAGIDDNIPAGFARGCKTEPGNKFPASPSVCGISARNPSSAMEVEKQKPGRVDGSTKAGRPKHAVDSAQGRGMGCLQAFGLPGAHYLDPDADQQDGGRAIDPCFVRGACGQQKGCTKRKCDQPTDEDLSMRSLRSRHEAVGDLAWPESHGRRHDEAKTPLPRTGQEQKNPGSCDPQPVQPQNDSGTGILPGGSKLSTPRTPWPTDMRLQLEAAGREGSATKAICTPRTIGALLPNRSLLKGKRPMSSAKTKQFRTPVTDRTPLMTPARTSSSNKGHARENPAPGIGSPLSPPQPLQMHDLFAEAERRSLSTAFGGALGPIRETCVQAVKSDVVQMTSETATVHRFSVGGPDAPALAGAAEFHARLLAAGAQERFITKQWVENHYRWIVWKLAAYERRDPGNLAGKALTAENVLEQLKYRYEREVNRSERSCLKKILEQDDSASRPMVLCVAALRDSQGQDSGISGPMLELTDGWYWVKAALDGHLQRLVRTGQVQVGDKLRICCAELVADRPAEPLQASAFAVLKLRANSTHKAPWDARLGFQKHGVVMVSLHCCLPGGGPLPCTLVLVQRRYPAMFWLQGGPGGSSSVTPAAMSAMERDYRIAAARVQEKAEAESRKEDDQWCKDTLRHGQNLWGTDDGAVLYAAIRQRFYSAHDLSEFQKACVERFSAVRQEEMRRRVEEKVALALQKQGIQKVDSAIPTVCLRVTPVLPSALVSQNAEELSTSFYIKIWRTVDDDFRDGSVYQVTGLEPRGSGVAAAMPGTRPQELHTGKNTSWSFIGTPETLRPGLDCRYQPPKVLKVGDLHALWRGQEFDIAGISLNIGNVFPEGSKAYQWAFFADDSVTCFAKRCREGNPDSPSIAPKVPLLAVKLTGYKAAVNWLPQTHAGCVMTCKSLTFDRFDSENLLWVAEASEKSCLSLADSPAGSMRSGIRTPINQATQVLNCSLLESAREVLDWASGRERLFRELQERIGLLLSS